jgi:hypothetical protein
MVYRPTPLGSKRRRLLNAVLDLATLPLVALGPRRTIELLGRRIPLHYEFRRWAWRSERCVELALGMRALRAHDSRDVLEVGNVMPLTGIGGHTVVDKYEKGPDVLNVDIVDYAPERRFGLVLSLSTLEHVGWDELPRDPGKAALALARLKDLSEPGGAMLVTIPVGTHRRLERAFTAPQSPFDAIALFVKTSRRARWTRREPSELSRYEYARPYALGNAILVGVRGDPFSTSSAQRAAPEETRHEGGAVR